MSFAKIGTSSLAICLQAKVSTFGSPQFDGPVIAYRSYKATAIRTDISTHHFPLMSCQGVCHFEVMRSPQLYSVVKACCHKVVPIIRLKLHLQTAQLGDSQILQLVATARMDVAGRSWLRFHNDV